MPSWLERLYLPWQGHADDFDRWELEYEEWERHDDAGSAD